MFDLLIYAKEIYLEAIDAVEKASFPHLKHDNSADTLLIFKVKTFWSAVNGPSRDPSKRMLLDFAKDIAILNGQI